MPGSPVYIPAPMPGAGILARLKPVAGVGSGLDADLVRGQAFPAPGFRWDFSPALTPPTDAAIATAAYLFGV